MSRTIFLDYASKRIELTEEGYQKIREIIQSHQLCPGCHHQVNDSEHMLVGKKCLRCVLDAHTNLMFVGFVRFNHDGYAVYSFTNSEGITYLSIENDSSSPQEDIAGSIEEADFTLPTTYKPFKATEDVELSRSYWKVYGQLSQSVVIIRYKDDYHHRNALCIDFLAYKKGQTIELSKRRSDHKAMVEKAKSLAERTKKGGYYHLNGERYTEIDETQLYPIIARLESADYDEQLSFLAMQAQHDTPLLTLLDATQPEMLPTIPDNLSLETQEDGLQQEPSDHVDLAGTTESQDNEVTDPAQENQGEEVQTEGKQAKRRKLHVVTQEPETNGEPTA